MALYLRLLFCAAILGNEYYSNLFYRTQYVFNEVTNG